MGKTDLCLAAIDPEALERLTRLGGARLLRQMIDLFLGYSSQHVEILRTADARLSSRQDAERAAHALKSAAGHVGATRLSELVSEFEAASTDHDVSRIVALNRALCLEYDHVSNHLAQIRVGLEEPA